MTKYITTCNRGLSGVDAVDILAAAEVCVNVHYDVRSHWRSAEWISDGVAVVGVDIDGERVDVRVEQRERWRTPGKVWLVVKTQACYLVQRAEYELHPTESEALHRMMTLSGADFAGDRRKENPIWVVCRPDENENSIEYAVYELEHLGV